MKLTKTLIFILFTLFSTASMAETSNPRVLVETTMGNFTLELNSEKAPKTVNNFLKYVKEGFYEKTIFHRVIGNFMIQGGGFNTDFVKKETHPPIKNEAFNGLRNARGTIAMARTNDPHSATAQFFINVVDNTPLNHRAKTDQAWGYTVFGKVTQGMDVVDKIRNVETTRVGRYRDVPKQQIIINKVSIIEEKAE